MAIFDFVLTTASVSSVSRIRRRSLAVYGPQERAYIENNVYNIQYPKILILEVRGAVFFGSSIQVLSNILDAAGINASTQEKAEISRINSPLPHHSRMNSLRVPESLSPASVSPGSRLNQRREKLQKSAQPVPIEQHMPRFLVLDLSSVSNVDASAARGKFRLRTYVSLHVAFAHQSMQMYLSTGCFLQLSKMCAARKIIVAAAGMNGRIAWIMQTHDCADHIESEEMADESVKTNQKIILFDDLNDALQYCEKSLVAEKPTNLISKQLLTNLPGASTSISLSTAFTQFGLEPDHVKALEEYEKSGKSFHSEAMYKAGEMIFSSGTNSDGFYIVLAGSVVVLKDGGSPDGNEILSGAGRQQFTSRRNIVENAQVSSIHPVGRIFGFVDFVLQRPRTFSVVAGAENTVVAKVSLSSWFNVYAAEMLTILAFFSQCHRDGLDKLKAENPDLDR